MMTPREIFQAQMHFGNTDRCFYTENGYWDELFDQWPIFLENGITDYKGACKLFEMDEIANLWVDILKPNTSILPPFDREMLSETATTIVRTNAYGTAEEKFKNGHSGGRMFRPSVTTPDDWKRIKEERFSLSHSERVIDIQAVRQRMRGSEDQPLYLYMGSLIGLNYRMLTFDGFMYACYDYPDMIEDMVETNCQLIENFLDQVLPHFKFDVAATYENITCKNGPMIPVHLFRDMVMPRLKRIKKKLHQYGIDVWIVGSDGDIRPLLPYFLEGGVNCLSPYEVVGCVHPGELLDQYPGELRIIGGVDKQQIAKGKEAIDTYLKSIAPYVARGGFIPHIDHDVPPSISQQDYLYYLEQKRRMFG